jgi:hypothetical protein
MGNGIDATPADTGKTNNGHFAGLSRLPQTARAL